MKRTILGGLAAAMAATAGGAYAADDTGAWYFNPMVQYSVVDSGRISADGFGYQLGLGTNFSKHWSGELNASISSLEIRTRAPARSSWRTPPTPCTDFFRTRGFVPMLWRAWAK